MQASMTCSWDSSDPQNLCALTGAVELSRRHPVASWLCAMLHCFGSYILADLLLGEPIIDYFSNSSSILLASGVW